MIVGINDPVLTYPTSPYPTSPAFSWFSFALFCCNTQVTARQKGQPLDNMTTETHMTTKMVIGTDMCEYLTSCRLILNSFIDFLSSLLCLDPPTQPST